MSLPVICYPLARAFSRLKTQPCLGRCAGAAPAAAGEVVDLDGASEGEDGGEEEDEEEGEEELALEMMVPEVGRAAADGCKAV